MANNDYFDTSNFDPTEEEIEVAKRNLSRSAKIMEKIQQEESQKRVQGLFNEAYKQAAEEYGVELQIL